jgi:quercetin dioxygenase-like cupin family protein
VIGEKDLEKKARFGDVYVRVMNLVEQPSFLVRTAVIPPNSTVPPKPHAHKLRQINYVIDGEPTVTNGKEAIKLKKGDFVVFKSFEEHYYSTTDTSAHIFEVQFE